MEGFGRSLFGMGGWNQLTLHLLLAVCGFTLALSLKSACLFLKLSMLSGPSSSTTVHLDTQHSGLKPYYFSHYFPSSSYDIF